MRKGYFSVGESVMIYEDPVSREIEEGSAVLVKFVSTLRGMDYEAERAERWFVRFTGEEANHERIVTEGN